TILIHQRGPRRRRGPSLSDLDFSGADDGIRTRDPNLGNDATAVHRVPPSALTCTCVRAPVSRVPANTRLSLRGSTHNHSVVIATLMLSHRSEPRRRSRQLMSVEADGPGPDEPSS